MGTCVSKCYPCNPSDQTREKLGFASASPRIVPNTSSSYSSYASPRIVPENVPNTSSSSYADPKIVPRNVPKTHHPSPPSSYTSSYTSSSSMASSSSTCSSSATTTATTNSTCKPFSNEFLLSCARTNPSLNLESPLSCAEDANYSIVVLDPKKRTWEKAKTKLPAPPPPPRTVAIRGPPSPSPRRNPSFPSKRARSSSPASRAGRKSFRADPPPPSSSPATAAAAAGGRWRARKEKLALDQGRSSRSLSSSKGANANANLEKERVSNRTHRIASPPQRPRGREVRGGEALLPKESFRASPLVEDLNNPLISMDCFIFL